jgi:hypothetical protein
MRDEEIQPKCIPAVRFGHVTAGAEEFHSYYYCISFHKRVLILCLTPSASLAGALDSGPGLSTVVLEYLCPRQRQLLKHMTSKQWTLIVLAVVLGGFSLYLNKDWFARENIQIHHRSRPARLGFSRRNRPTAPSSVDPIFFAFDRKLKLTSLKVIPVSEIETNKYPHPIWELVSESNSVPVAEWSYGWPIRGMRPSVKGATPDPLEPGVKYRLLVQAGHVKAQDDFVPVPATP